MMLASIIIAILTPILVYYLLKELIPYLRYHGFYKSQGIKYHHTPLLGYVGAFLSPGSKDITGNFKVLMNEKYKKYDIVAFNNHDSTQLTFMINNLNLYKDYFTKELDHIKRKNFIEAPFGLGFFLEVGHQALKKRAIFNEFFEGENLEKMTPEIRKIILSHIEKLKQKYRENLANHKNGKKSEEKFDEENYMEYDFRTFTPDLFSDLVTKIMFGDKEQPIINGHPLPESIEENMIKTIDIWKNPINLLSGGLMEKISPQLSVIKRDSENIKEAIRRVIKNRLEKTKNEDLGVNLLDLMIKFNRNCGEEEKLSMEDMVDSVTVFQLAGQDTTRSSSEATVKLLSSRHNLKKKIFENEILKNFHKNEDFLNGENYEKCETLIKVITESMRMAPPASHIFPKLITKDLKLGKYTLKKGSLMFFPLIVYQFREEIFENSKVFNEERYTKEKVKKIPRNAFMPFYSGRRACVGKYLAERIQRMLMVEFLKAFEIKDNGKEYETVVRFTHGVKESEIFLKCRE